MSEQNKIVVGDRVRFRAGRGESEGRVANITDGIATIATENGYLVNRRLIRLTRITPDAKPAFGIHEPSERTH